MHAQSNWIERVCDLEDMMHKSRSYWLAGILLSLTLILAGTSLARESTQATKPEPMTTSFSYQGQLSDEGALVDATCDMEFSLYDAAEGGSQVGGTINASVPVAEGVFATQLDFGSSPFGQEARWLGIQVQCPDDVAPVDLGRQALTAAPYALYAESAPWEGVDGAPAELNDGDDVDDTVSWGEISNLVGTGSQQVAAGDHLHDDRYYTESELQSSGSAAVHWDNLDSLPAGLADGDQVDDTVSWSEISGIVGEGQSQVSAGDHYHDSAYYTQSQLQSSGSAAVHWGNFSSVPAGFADGVDHVGGQFAQVVVVAQSGGDSPGVQLAIDSITDASAENPYLVWVAPGDYYGMVTMKPYVHLQGAGEQATKLNSSIRLASQVTLRDLTVGGISTGVALRAQDPISNTMVANVTALALASGVMNQAILVDGGDIQMELVNVTAEAAGGSSYNYGLYQSAADLTMRNCSFTARGGTHARGILVITAGASLEAFDSQALAENSSEETVGLYTGSEAVVTLQGGSFSGRSGTEVKGIENHSYNLQANEIAAAAEGGSSTNAGIENDGGSAFAVLRGGSYSASDGLTASGILNTNNATLQAITVLAQGEDGSTRSVGFYHSSGAETQLLGGRFVGSGGSNATGLYCVSVNSTLSAQEVYALGQNAVNNYGLYNFDRCQVTLVGGSLIGRGGTGAYGLRNAGNTYSSTSITAEGIWALGEEASTNEMALYNHDGATATLTQSVLEGDSNVISRASGTVTVADSRLEGGAVSGTVTCILVTRGTTISTDGSTCP